MKLTEAKKIVSAIIQWQFVLQGINDREDVKIFDLSSYSLEDLIKANKLVTSNNSRKRKLQAYWQKKNGKSNGISQQLTMSDRLIAGVYTALNFQSNGEMQVLINDKAIGVVTANYE